MPKKTAITNKAISDKISVNISINISPKPEIANNKRKIAKPNKPLKNKFSFEYNTSPMAIQIKDKNPMETIVPINGELTIKELATNTMEKASKTKKRIH